eukprot:scaffold34925_cov150-Amphora_coffeaeformis.AAC.5
MQRVGHPRAASRRTMSPFELQNRVQACDNAESRGILQLDVIVRFRRRTRQNPVSFQDFLQSLIDTKGISTVHCYPSMPLGIRQDEWHQIVCTFGRMENLSHLAFPAGYGGFNGISANALSEVLEQTSSIKTLILSEGVVIMGPVEDLQRLAHAIAVSGLTTLACDCLFRFAGRQIIATEGVALCTTLQSLSLRDHMRHLSEEDVTSLVLRLKSLRHLSLYTCHWQALGRVLENNNSIEKLEVTDHDVVPELFCSFMNSLHRNQCLLTLTLKVRQGFTDDSMKEAVFAFLRCNETLENLDLIDMVDGVGPPLARSFSHFDMSALVSSIAANGQTQVHINGLGSFVHDDDREQYFLYRDQVHVENNLNRLGRRMLRKRPGDRVQFTKALLKLVEGNNEETLGICTGGFLDLYRTRCLFAFFRMNPSFFDGLQFRKLNVHSMEYLQATLNEHK